MTDLVITVAIGGIALTLAFFVWRLSNEKRNLRTRYSGIMDLEAELTAARNRLEQTRRDQQEFDSENERRRTKLNEEYEQALTTYKELKNEISLVEENLEEYFLRSLPAPLQLPDTR